MKRVLGFSVLWGMLLIEPCIQPADAQTANHVVVSEIYGGGGNSGSMYTNDFVELAIIRLRLRQI